MCISPSGSVECWVPYPLGEYGKTVRRPRFAQLNKSSLVSDGDALEKKFPPCVIASLQTPPPTLFFLFFIRKIHKRVKECRPRLNHQRGKWTNKSTERTIFWRHAIVLPHFDFKERKWYTGRPWVVWTTQDISYKKKKQQLQPSIHPLFQVTRNNCWITKNKRLTQRHMGRLC